MVTVLILAGVIYGILKQIISLKNGKQNNQ